MEFEFESNAIKGLEKCAIIYRKDPLSFIYVCFHCGESFPDIDCTLQHIELHFQLVQVTFDEIDQKSEPIEPENTDENIVCSTELDIKTETMEIEEHDDGETSHKHVPEFECDKCGKKFKRRVNFKKHLSKHVDGDDNELNLTREEIRQPHSTTGQEQPDVVQTKKRLSNKMNKVKSRETTRQLSTYVCHRCTKMFKKLTDLNDHLSTHSKDDILQINKCKECKRYFESSFDLRLHVLEAHHFVRTFKCVTCRVEFKKDDKSSLAKHLESHLSKGSVEWTDIVQGICNKGEDVSRYEDIKSSIESSCELCGEKFYIKSNFDEHVRCMHWNNNYELRCTECDAVFTKTMFYYAHQLEHRRVGATIIDTDIYALLLNLNAYIEEHFVCNEEENSSNPYKCTICGVDRCSLFEIRRHVRERHVYKTLPQPIRPNLQDRFTCNICGASIKRKSFKTHLMTHSDIRTHKCSTCDKTFRTNFGKVTHERLHSGEKPFQCDQCGKRFFSNSLLGAHKKSHDNTTYPCKVCGRVFNVPSGYRRHIQIHRNDKSFDCTVCSKSFTTRVYLTRHMFKHSEKNYHCTFCENKFNTASGLKQHQKSKHNYEAP